jgi:hypothetical protein
MAIRKKGGESPVHRIFVRIGALRRFHTLTQKTADLPVEVVWDRRRDERREGEAPADGDRRQADRRKKPPFTWETADFVVAEAEATSPEESAPESKRPSKKS